MWGGPRISRPAPNRALGAGPGSRAQRSVEGTTGPLRSLRFASPAREPAQVSEIGVLRAECGHVAAPGASHARQDRVTRARAPGARFDNDGHWNLRRSACRPPCAPPSSESNDRRGFGAPAEARPCSASVERLDRAGPLGTRRCNGVAAGADPGIRLRRPRAVSEVRLGRTGLRPYSAALRSRDGIPEPVWPARPLRKAELP